MRPCTKVGGRGGATTAPTKTEAASQHLATVLPNLGRDHTETPLSSCELCVMAKRYTSRRDVLMLLQFAQSTSVRERSQGGGG